MSTSTPIIDPEVVRLQVRLFELRQKPSAALARAKINRSTWSRWLNAGAVPRASAVKKMDEAIDQIILEKGLKVADALDSIGLIEQGCRDLLRHGFQPARIVVGQVDRNRFWAGVPAAATVPEHPSAECRVLGIPVIFERFAVSIAVHARVG